MTRSRPRRGIFGDGPAADNVTLTGERALVKSALGVDLGTTRIKAAELVKPGRLGGVTVLPAPPLQGTGYIRESDPLVYFRKAEQLLAEGAARLAAPVAVGLSAQRSSFLLWDRDKGTPRTPLISWQDRRAEKWCRRKGKVMAEKLEHTGLPFSPHYAGPKLGYIFSTDKALRRAAHRGEVLFGTLDTWLLWRISGGEHFSTDLSMAARTLMADPVKGKWDDALLALLGVPPAILPVIRPSWGIGMEISREIFVEADLADQSAALHALSGTSDGGVLVNLGTGGFVLSPSRIDSPAFPGYLRGPAGLGPGGEKPFQIEGTINGLAAALAGTGGAQVFLEDEDCSGGLFCMPDTAGYGSPYWNPAGRQTFSRSPDRMTTSQRKQSILEGIIFRVRQILEGIVGKREHSRIFLSGGLAADPFLGAALAACLEYPVYRLREKEASLLGAASLAAGERDYELPLSVIPVPPEAGRYLPGKYLAWRIWADSLSP